MLKVKINAGKKFMKYNKLPFFLFFMNPLHSSTSCKTLKCLSKFQLLKCNRASRHIDTKNGIAHSGGLTSLPSNFHVIDQKLEPKVSDRDNYLIPTRLTSA